MLLRLILNCCSNAALCLTTSEGHMKPSLHRLLPLLFIFAAAPALAGFDMDYPVVDKGGFEVGYTGVRTGDDTGSESNNAQEHEIALHYGFTDDFAASLVLQGGRDMANSFHGTGYGFNAQYEFTEQGDWWLSSGVLGEYVHTSRDGEADGAEFKLLLERQQGPVAITANLIAGRDVGEGREHGVGLESAIAVVYGVNDHFNPGLEWVAGWGNTADAIDGDEHYVGPVVGGDIVTFETNGHESAISYNVGYFWGLTGDSVDNSILFQLAYGVAF